MTFRLFNCTSILLLLVCLQAFASDKPGNPFLEKKNISVRYDPGVDETIHNYFIKEIARLNFLNLNATEYAINLDIHGEIVEGGPNGYSLKFVINDTISGGDFYYKGFDLSEVLLPWKYEMSVVLSCPIKKDTIQLSRILPNRNWVVLLDSTDISNLEQTKLSIVEIKPRYHRETKRDFNNRIAEINKFLAYDELLELNLKKAQQINPETQDSILPVLMQIYDLKRFENLLHQVDANFSIPENRLNKLATDKKKLNAHLRRLQTLIGQSIETSSNDFSETQYNDAAQTLIEIQSNYLKTMSATDHLYEPGFIEVADIFPNAESWVDFSGYLSQIAFTDVEKATANLLEFASVLYQNYSTKTDSLIAKQYFNEAELFAENSKTLCEVNPDDDCDILTFNKIAQTKFGVYDAYLRVAQTAIENNNPDFGYKYLQLAGEFQKENSGFIISRAAIDRGLEGLAWSYFQLADKQFDYANLQDALEKYVNASEIYKTLDINQYLDLIDKKIDRCIQALEELAEDEE
jgi:hypothetical protein